MCAGPVAVWRCMALLWRSPSSVLVALGTTVSTSSGGFPFFISIAKISLPLAHSHRGPFLEAGHPPMTIRHLSQTHALLEDTD